MERAPYGRGPPTVRPTPAARSTPRLSTMVAARRPHRQAPADAPRFTWSLPAPATGETSAAAGDEHRACSPSAANRGTRRPAKESVCAASTAIWVGGRGASGAGPRHGRGHHKRQSGWNRQVGRRRRSGCDAELWNLPRVMLRWRGACRAPSVAVYRAGIFGQHLELVPAADAGDGCQCRRSDSRRVSEDALYGAVTTAPDVLGTRRRRRRRTGRRRGGCR